jgi:DNA repair protein RadA/Sms
MDRSEEYTGAQINVDDASAYESVTERPYMCARCRYKCVVWTPTCPGCRKYNTLELNTEPVPLDEDGEEPDYDTDVEDGELPRAVCIGKMKFKRHERLQLGIEGFDHVLCPRSMWQSKKKAKGAVFPSLIGLTGDPGAGKSTLVLQALCNLSQQGLPVGIIDFEESAEDTNDRTKMCGFSSRDTQNLHVVAFPNYLEDAFESMTRLGVQVVLVNSLQEVICQDEEGERVATKAGITSNEGDPTMMKRAARICLNYSKRQKVLVFLIIQVQANGEMDGVGNKIRHKLDVSLEVRKHADYEVEGSDGHKIIILGSEKNKNRYADDTVRAQFYRGDHGLEPRGIIE